MTKSIPSSTATYCISKHIEQESFQTQRRVDPMIVFFQVQESLPEGMHPSVVCLNLLRYSIVSRRAHRLNFYATMQPTCNKIPCNLHKLAWISVHYYNMQACTQLQATTLHAFACKCMHLRTHVLAAFNASCVHLREVYASACNWMQVQVDAIAPKFVRIYHKTRKNNSKSYIVKRVDAEHHPIYT